MKQHEQALLWALVVASPHFPSHVAAVLMIVLVATAVLLRKRGE